MADRKLIGVLATRLRDTLADLVPARSTVAVIGFPNHPNPGDSAIWLGVVAGLTDLDCRIAYTCDFHTYDRAALRRAVGPGPILITGGGNFGDLYPAEQELRERVVADFAGNPIVQLPQSVHFRDGASIDRARGVLRSHERFSLIVRDVRSVKVVEDELGIEPVLCPDCAFLLGPLVRPAPASRPITVLRRKDGEAASPEAVIDGVVPVDWMDEPARPLERASVHVRHYARDHPSRRAPVGRLMSMLYPALARRRLSRGVRVLSSGRVVVTDRLHGHILALLLGIPHVVTDTAQGKISAFVETWTADSGLVRTAPDFPSAWATALEWERRLAAEGQP